METLVEIVAVGRARLELERPTDPESLLDEARFAEDEFLPYWAEPWPSGRALADHVGLLPLAGLRVVELGCGLGLPSLVAAAAGATVLATDWASEAIDLVRRNAARNGLSLAAERLDWRELDAFVDLGPFDLALAADVAYEARHAEPLGRLLAALRCTALLTDPGRAHTAMLIAAVEASGSSIERVACAALPGGALYRVHPAQA